MLAGGGGSSSLSSPDRTAAAGNAGRAGGVHAARVRAGQPLNELHAASS